MNKGIIFDFDGVIVPTVDRLFNIYNEVKVELGINDKYEDLDYLNGLTINQICSHLKSKYNINLPFEEIERIYDNRLTDLYSNCEVNKPVFNFIGLLKNNNIPMSLGSSCPRKYIEIVLERFGMSEYFESVISGGDVVSGKPCPDIFIKCIEHSSFDSALVVDDSSSGVLAALAADCLVFKFDKKMSNLEDLSIIMTHFHNEISYLGSEDILILEPEKYKYELDGIDNENWSVIEKNGEYNSPLLCLTPSDMTSLKSIKCYQKDYRYYRLKMNNGEVSVAVTGVVSNEKGELLLGRRSLNNFQYRNRLDMVPAGGLENEEIIGQLNSEWVEETNSSEDVYWVGPKMLYLSKKDRVLDIVVHGRVKGVPEDCYSSEEFMNFSWIKPTFNLLLEATPLAQILLELEASLV